MSIVSRIRRTLADFLLGPERKRLQELTRAAVNDWRAIPYLASRDNQELLDRLSEVDPHMVQYLLQQLEYTSLGGSNDVGESFRKSVVERSRTLYLTDPNLSFAIDLWTDYAVGSPPNLTTEDPDAQEVWDEFWQADRNAPVLSDRELHRLSETELTDGELYFALFSSTVDGTSTIRTVATDQIAEIVHDPEDSSIVLFYRRDFTDAQGERVSWYYPDWHAAPEMLDRAKLPAGAVRADRVRAGSLSEAGTDVVMLQAAFRKIRDHGYPLATTVLDWNQVYKQFLQDRAAVSKAAATWVQKIRAKTSQRGLDALRSRLGSSITTGNSVEANPPPVAGSTWLENDAAELSWMNRPTGAADAEKDGVALLTQLGLGFKLYPHYMGRGDYYRLATATAMEGPVLKSFSRYQAFWESVWRDVCKIVLTFKERHSGVTYQTRSCIVSSEAILTQSPESLTAAADTLTSLVEAGLVGPVVGKQVAMAVMRSLLGTIGIQEADEILDAEQAAVAAATTANELFQEDGTTSYEKTISGLVHKLWSGGIERGEFAQLMDFTINAGLRQAYVDGLKAVGLTAEDMTEEEDYEVGSLIMEQLGMVNDLAEYIEQHNKGSGATLASLQWKINLWTNQYARVCNQGKLTASADPPLTWHEGDTAEKCEDCKWADGKTYRSSIWTKYGWATQSQDLACSGYNCRCSLDPAEPGTKLQRGRPKTPSGGG